MLQFENAVNRYNALILSELKDANIKCWIAGGALRDYFAGVKINTDYDLFFPSQVEYDKSSAYFKSNSAVVKWESENGMKVVYRGKTFDLIKKFFDSPIDTINAFDFTVSMFAVDSERIYHGETSFIDLAKRQLMINKITYPASTLSRSFRYYQKGYKMCLGEMKKLVLSIQDMEKPKPEGDLESNEDVSSGDSMFKGID